MLGYDYDNPHDDRSSFDPADDTTIRTGHDSISNTNVRSSLSLDYRSYDSAGTKSLQFQIDDYLEKDVQPLRDSTGANVRDNSSVRDLGHNPGPHGSSVVTSHGPISVATSSINNVGMLLSQPPPQSSSTTALSSSSSSSLHHMQRSHQSSELKSKPIDDSDDEFSPIRRSHSHTITTTTATTNNNVNRSNNNNNHSLKNGSIAYLASSTGPLPSVTSANQFAQQSGY